MATTPYQRERLRKGSYKGTGIYGPAIHILAFRNFQKGYTLAVSIKLARKEYHYS